ncbi:hypothetical protein DOQ73_25030, partial [Salmonella enterica subsp. enterica]|nr:hypothetical protein [Salmonella enterica subsp. enterica serovar Javiana]
MALDFAWLWERLAAKAVPIGGRLTTFVNMLRFQVRCRGLSELMYKSEAMRMMLPSPLNNRVVLPLGIMMLSDLSVVFTISSASAFMF